MFEKINLGNNEKMNSSESWQPCMWCDYPEDTCSSSLKSGGGQLER